MSGRGLLGGAATGMLLVALTGCVAAPPLPTTTAPPLTEGDGVPTPVSAPLVEVVVLQPGETFASTCADAPLTSDDPAVLYCPTDGASGTRVAPAEAMLAAWTGLAPGMQGLPAGDFSAGFALAHGFARHVADELARQFEIPAPTEESDAVRVADCFAGVWSWSADDRGLLEAGDIGECIDAYWR